jgi:hypothetical protein
MNECELKFYLMLKFKKLPLHCTALHCTALAGFDLTIHKLPRGDDNIDCLGNVIKLQIRDKIIQNPTSLLDCLLRVSSYNKSHLNVLYVIVAIVSKKCIVNISNKCIVNISNECIVNVLSNCIVNVSNKCIEQIYCECIEQLYCECIEQMYRMDI